MKILLLTIPAGGGHHQTAKAVSDYFAKDAGTECRVLDVAKYGNGFVAQVISKGYVFVCTYLASGYRLFYNLMDKRTRHSYTFVTRLLDMVLGKKLVEYIEEYNPDVIISTHLFASVVLNIRSKKHKIDKKLISIITDFTIHPMWEQVTSDYFITASSLLENEAKKKLISTENVLPLGIPIKDEFLKTAEKSEARKSLELSDKFTVLVMMGSFGYGRATTRLIKQLDSAGEDFQVVVACGSNKNLKKKITSRAFKKVVKVYGFYDNMSELMDCCDCIITKPGGLSTSEALVKNIPMILTNAIPGHEERNLEFIKGCGACLTINKENTVDKAISQLMHSDEVLCELQKNARNLAKPDATRDLAELIYKIKE